MLEPKTKKNLLSGNTHLSRLCDNFFVFVVVVVVVILFIPKEVRHNNLIVKDNLVYSSAAIKTT